MPLVPCSWPSVFIFSVFSVCLWTYVGLIHFVRLLLRVLVRDPTALPRALAMKFVAWVFWSSAQRLTLKLFENMLRRLFSSPRAMAGRISLYLVRQGIFCYGSPFLLMHGLQGSFLFRGFPFTTVSCWGFCYQNLLNFQGDGSLLL